MKRLILTLVALLVCSPLARGQALPTATRRGAIQAGGAFVANFPDYTRSKFYGYGAYVDFDFNEHIGVEYDYKYSYDTTTQLNSMGAPSSTGNHVPSYERTNEIAARYYRNYARFNPYARVGIGRGSIEFPPLPPPSNQNVSQGVLGYWMATAGAGLDFTLTRHLSLRADFEAQDWFSRKDSPSPNNINGLPRGLTPFVYTGGIGWRFGYGNTMGDYKYLP